VPHLDKWEKKDKGHTQDEWLIGMIEIGGIKCNTEILRTDLQRTAERDPQNSLRAWLENFQVTPFSFLLSTDK
jgi:hypothetical protein